MSLRGSFPHKANIERASFSTDSFGEEQATWTLRHDHVPCRLVISSQSVASPTEGHQVITRYRLFLHPDVDVQQDDQVSKVFLEGDETEGPFEITQVLPRRDRRKKRLVVCEMERWPSTG